MTKRHEGPCIKCGHDNVDKNGICQQAVGKERSDPYGEPCECPCVFPPEAIYYNFAGNDYDQAFVNLFNMVIFALDQDKAGQLARNSPTILAAYQQLTLRAVWLKHKETCDGWVDKANSNQEGTENWVSQERCQICNPEVDETEDNEAKFRSLVELIRDLEKPIQHYFPISGLHSYKLKMRVDGALKDFEKIYPRGERE